MNLHALTTLPVQGYRQATRSQGVRLTFIAKMVVRALVSYSQRVT
jgi:hypothetical protein